jgi:hypothetical protein
MNNLRCSNCDFLNFATATACKRCGLTFDSSAGTDAGTDWNPQPTAFPETHPQPNESGSFFWDQPQPTYQPNYYPSAPAPASRGVSKLAIILIVVAVVLVVSGIAIPKLLKSEKTDFTNLTWYEHQAPDKKFSVSLPVTPKMYVRTIPTPFGEAQARVLEAGVGKDGGCMVIATDYAVGNLKMSEDTIYDMAIKGATRTDRAMKIGARKDIMLFGRKGVEVELLSNDSKTAGFIGSIRIFWVSPRLYVVATGGPDTAEFRAVQTRCLDSFRISESN